MRNLLREMIDKKFGPHFLPQLVQQVRGLAEDYWEDGSENLLSFGLEAGTPMPVKKKEKKANAFKPQAAAPRAKMPAAKEKQYTEWHAAPGEISEKMWGDGFVTPGDETINNLLVRPLGLTKAMSVADLSAGLGGRMRRTAEETGAYITGMEPDAELAQRGMEMSIRAGQGRHAVIQHYNPSAPVFDRHYDAFIARETFYRVPNMAAFCEAVAKNSKPQAQLAFTDYILDPEHRQNPAIVAWQKHEKLAQPMGLVDSSQIWAKHGFAISVHEDLTNFYLTEVADGIKRLMRFLASGVKPDKETAASLLRRVEMWQHRIAALNAGLKFYRFYGKKR